MFLFQILDAFLSFPEEILRDSKIEYYFRKEGKIES